MALQIDAYQGDGIDLAELITGTWNKVYGGRAWFPVWDQDFVAWRMMDPRVLDREMMVCAYDDGRLIGCLLAEPTELRVGTRRVQGSLASYLSVDPETRHRGLGVRLLDQQRRLHEQRGLQLSLGVSNSLEGAQSKKFWDGVARRWPKEFALLGGLTMWCHVVDAGAIAAAGLSWFERWGPRAQALVPGGLSVSAAKTRPFRASDLDPCLAWTLRQGEVADCQMIWSRQRLSLQLDHPYARTWVAERDGRPSGFVNGYLITWSGGQPVRVGFIELCAAEGGALAQASLLSRARRAMADEGAQMVVVMNAGAQPRAAMLAAGFMPMNPHVQKMALLGELAGTLSAPTRLHCAFT
jgi:ribosomal protein S18 acetylase RimI-like enzyme